MKRKNILLIPVLLFLLLSCETKPPTQIDEIEKFGEVKIASNIVDAQIIVDEEDTGLFTPAVLSLEEGNHIITVQKENFLPLSKTVEVLFGDTVEVNFMLVAAEFKKVVLLEDFANVSCTPCVVANKIIHSLLANEYNENVVSIKYHVNFPSPNDPLYLASRTGADCRRTLYGVTSTPQIFIDGILNPTATDSNDIKSGLNSRLSNLAQVVLSVKDSLEGSQIKGKVTVEFVGGDVNTLKDYKLFIAVTETEIQYSTPPGSNGEKVFYDVMREMIPATGGTSITNSSIGESVDYNYSVQINSKWNVDNIRIVAFIQHINTNEIIQAVSNH